MRRNTGLANFRILVVLVALAAALAMLPHHRAVPRHASRHPHPPPKHYTHVHEVDPAAKAAALAWAERLLAHAPERLPHFEDVQPLLWTAQDARDAFGHIIAKYGPSARAELGLGKCCLRLGLYRDAVAAFSRALGLRSAAGEAGSWLRKAKLLCQVSCEVQPMLPRGSTVLRVRAYPEPVPGRSWLVLSGILDSTGNPALPPPHMIVLSLFSAQGGSYRRVWQSGPITGSSRDASDNALAVDLIVDDLDSGAVPQVLVHEDYPGGDLDLEHVSVWSWEHGGVATVGLLDSIDGISEGRIERGRQRAIFVTNRIDSATRARPLWTDAYAWRDGRLQSCDRLCPHMVRESMRQLRRTLEDLPGDTATLRYLGAAYDLLGYHRRALTCYQASRKEFQPDSDPVWDLTDLGHVYDIAVHPTLAIQAYRAAEREFLHEIKRPKDPDDRWWLEGDLARVRHRLAAGAPPASGWVSLADD